jgi:hypothetical protein
MDMVVGIGSVGYGARVRSRMRLAGEQIRVLLPRLRRE